MFFEHKSFKRPRLTDKGYSEVFKAAQSVYKARRTDKINVQELVEKLNENIEKLNETLSKPENREMDKFTIVSDAHEIYAWSKEKKGVRTSIIVIYDKTKEEIIVVQRDEYDIYEDKRDVPWMFSAQRLTRTAYEIAVSYLEKRRCNDA